MSRSSLSCKIERAQGVVAGAHFFQHVLAVPNLLESNTPRVARQRRARKTSYLSLDRKLEQGKGRRWLARANKRKGKEAAEAHLVSRTTRAYGR